jgi:hypothetical protein
MGLTLCEIVIPSRSVFTRTGGAKSGLDESGCVLCADRPRVLADAVPCLNAAKSPRRRQKFVNIINRIVMVSRFSELDDVKVASQSSARRASIPKPEVHRVARTAFYQCGHVGTSRGVYIWLRSSKGCIYVAIKLWPTEASASRSDFGGDPAPKSHRDGLCLPKATRLVPPDPGRGHPSSGGDVDYASVPQAILSHSATDYAQVARPLLHLESSR